MSWAARKRALYISSFFTVVALLLIGVGWYFFYDAPTCFDGVANGNEDGIDCGGRCERVCPFQAVPPIVKWQRFTELTPGVYNAAALVENPNAQTFAKDVPYSFKLYDSDNVLVHEATGRAVITSNRLTPIFVERIVSTERTPARIFFEFLAPPEWERVRGLVPDITIRDVALTKVDTTPRVDARIQNESLTDIRNVDVVAILYDGDGNVVALSKTTVSFLPSEGTQRLIFTWPRAFTSPVAEVLVLPIVVPS